MSNVIQFSINGDTNAEQVTARAKTAVSGFDKQVEGIGKKFAGSFKDIFLSFLGPMALLSAAVGFLTKAFSDIQKQREEANQAAIDGTNKLMSAEDKYWANKTKNEQTKKKTEREAEVQRRTTTEEFLLKDPRGNKIYDEEMARLRSSGNTNPFALDLGRNYKIQQKVQKILAEDAKNNPLPGKDTTFQAPAGFSNVIGVGANPVLENLTRQSDIQQQILDHIKQNQPAPGGASIDFTKEKQLINK